MESPKGSWQAAAFLCLLFLSGTVNSASAGYIYPDTCPEACAPATPEFNQTCIGLCNTCLLANGCKYSQFQPIFNGSQWGGFQCWCYLPWWAWMLVGIGTFIVAGGLLFALGWMIFTCMFPEGLKREAAKAAVKHEAQAAASAVGV